MPTSEIQKLIAQIQDGAASLTDQTWQRKAVLYLEPILRFDDKTPLYGLASRNQADLNQARLVLEAFLREPVHLIQVDMAGVVGKPDWATHQAVGRSLFEVVFSSKSVPGVFMDQFLQHFARRYNRTNNYSVAGVTADAAVNGELTAKLSRQIGRFDWIDNKGTKFGGASMILHRNVKALARYYIAAVMDRNRTEADLALRLLNVMRCVLFPGEKTVEPHHWYVLTDK